ncbi:oxidoreductase [Frankia sp. AgPm24]|uniref:Oxidoreductase n=1 Tax=Frankia umida TaxID=573489 RepID=A0ABT0K5E6_9ACTN|nr:MULTISPECIES: oxidoreductase [Frankia]MCK9879010.1 oxidoreductase [Frankia umida]MCK9920678.1 oxidoreductase [Frankia sp. AgPm24]
MYRRDRKTPGWGLAEVPDLRGRRVVVTGADSGIGFQMSRILAGRGATVILACRDLLLARQAADRIRADVAAAGPRPADVRVQHLDLASLASVRAAAERIRVEHPALDLLVNNAGVMRPVESTTEDGFDRTLGVNYLGHFALTGLLLDRLLASPSSRVVVLSSLAHHVGRIDPVGLAAGSPPFGPASVSASTGRRQYPASKLAMLMFAFELQRRLAAVGAPTIAVATHPGVARTGLAQELPAVMRAFMTDQMSPMMGWLIHSAQAGALAPIRAAVDPAASGGEYYGPDGLFGTTGAPTFARVSRAARNRAGQRLLWAESERVTGIRYLLRPSAVPPLTANLI